MAWGDGEKTPGAWLARNSLGPFFFIIIFPMARVLLEGR